MSKDTFILLLVIIFSYIYFKSIRENFELRRIRGEVDGVYIQPSKTIVDVPIASGEYVVDGVPIKSDKGDTSIEGELKDIIPTGTTYNMTDDGILPKIDQYNISGVIPSGVNPTNIFGFQKQRIREDALRDAFGI